MKNYNTDDANLFINYLIKNRYWMKDRYPFLYPS